MTGRLAVLTALALAVASTVEAQPYRPVRLQAPPVIDGRVDEPAWLDIAPLPVTQNFPVFRGPMTSRSEIRLAYDDEYLYASGRFEGDSPRGQSLARDRASDSDELFGVILDTFDDNENALVFITTPAGIRVDQTVFGDAQMLNNEMPFNESWNTFWDAASVMTADGWETEVRIPWSSLRFQDVDGTVDMGLITWRWSPMVPEGHSYPEIDPKWGMTGAMKPSIGHPVRFEGIYARRPLYVTPYALAGLRREAEQPESGAPWDVDSDPATEAGLDLKYGLTSNLTLDLTVNTDFAQVEADDQQVNLTRFSLFFPEKRQFFQERSSVFEFNTGGQTRLFYTRTIGLSDEGPVRLLGGARLVGRTGRWDVGAMNLQTARTRFSTEDGPLEVPSENFGVLRLRRQVFNAFSYAGGIVTSRLGEDGTYNVAYGVDGTFRLGAGQDYLLVGWAQTFDDTVSTSPGSPESSLARLRFERRTSTGTGWELGLTRAGDQYEPGMGFVFRTDFTRIGDRIYRAWQPGEGSSFYSIQMGVAGEAYFRNGDGSLESARVGPEITLIHRSGAFGVFHPALYVEDLAEPFELDDDLEVPAGHYRFAGVTAVLAPQPRIFRVGATFDAGTFYDGWRVSVGLQPTWNLSRFLELGAELELNRIGFPDRDQTYRADIGRMRIRAAADTHLSFTAFLQYSAAADEIGVNARVRYNFSEGHDLYVVYNEGINTDRYRERPVLPLSESRAVLVKYAYTFTR